MYDSEKGYENSTFDLGPCIKSSGEEAGRRDGSFQMRNMPRHDGARDGGKAWILNTELMLSCFAS